MLVLLSLLVMLFAKFQIEQNIDYENALRQLNREVQKTTEWVDYWRHHQEYYYKHGVPRTWYEIEEVEYQLEDYTRQRDKALVLQQAYRDKDWRAYNLAMNDITGGSPFYTYLAEKNLPPIGPRDTTPWGFLRNSWRQLLPKVLGIIALLFSVNRIHQDRRYGTIKTRLQQPKKRIFYLTRKTALSFTASCLIVFIPFVLMFTFLGVGQGYAGANLPVLYSNERLFQLFRSDEDYFERQAEAKVYCIGPDQVAEPWGGRFEVFYISGVEYIALWKLLLLSALLIALFILFCTVLALLISVVVKKEVLAQIIAIVVFLFGSSFGYIFPKHSTSAIDLFSKADAVRIVEGSSWSATFLNSIVTLLIATILLFAICAFVFRRQDEH